MKNVREISERIVSDIIKDFSDRRGLRQGWDNIDVDTQEEIKETWISMVYRHLDKEEIFNENKNQDQP